MQLLSVLRNFGRRLHNDRRGAVSLETVLIIGAIAIPVLIGLYRYGWPMIYDYFVKGMTNLDNDDYDPTNGISP
ncbi:MAG: hypothetical protein ACK5Q5_02515 [Planctomycetaceae bacterium]